MSNANVAEAKKAKQREIDDPLAPDRYMTAATLSSATPKPRTADKHCTISSRIDRQGPARCRPSLVRRYWAWQADL